MGETKPSQAAVKPEEKPTVQMGAAPQWGLAILDKVAEGFSKVDTRLTTIEANQALQGGQVLDIGRRMTAIESRVGGLEGRAESHSLRVGRESDVNLKQDAVLAEVLTKVNAIEAKPDTTDRLITEVKDAAKTPMGQKIVGAALTVLLLALTLLAFKLQAQVNHLESKPETVQAAPTVYVPVPTPMAVIADAGAR